MEAPAFAGHRLIVAVQNDRASEKLVRELVSRITSEVISGSRGKTAVFLIHVSTSCYDGEWHTAAVQRFMRGRFTDLLRLLPVSVPWHMSAVTVRQPQFHFGQDMQEFCGLALCEKATELNASAIVLQGSQNELPILPLIMGRSLAHYVQKQSSLPIYLCAKSNLISVRGQGYGSDKGLRSFRQPMPQLSPVSEHTEAVALVSAAA